MAEFHMPSLGADMKEGTLVQWSVKVGDRVKRGDIIGVVATEKADIEVEVYESGVIDRLVANPGDILPVGAVLALIRDEGQPAAAPAVPVVAITGEPTPPPPAKPAEARPAPPTPAPAVPEHVRASPLARRIAQELGVDLREVHGTGPHGAISQEDIEKAAAAHKAAGTHKQEPPPQPPAPALTPEPRAGMRRAIAAAMARSNREIPHYYLETRIDVSRALKFLESENQKRSVPDRILFAVLLVKAVALALKEVPDLNAYWVEDHLDLKGAIHVGLAISLRQGGLVVPAIHDVDQRSLGDLMAAMRDLITRARGGRLRSSELTDATITITNLGDLGVETVHGVIYPPQVALVGFGRVVESPWAEGGMLGVRPVLTATLAGDHRATDGRRGAQFLTALNRLLQEPEKL
jgi:pyruvate dehydrogenase E2 component (dihydrolipoamide acetyltransferase)